LKDNKGFKLILQKINASKLRESINKAYVIRETICWHNTRRAL